MQMSRVIRVFFMKFSSLLHKIVGLHVIIPQGQSTWNSENPKNGMENKKCHAGRRGIMGL
jgi:hypothetical protein